MSEHEIYTVLRGPIRGQLGEDSVTETEPECPACGRRPRMTVQSLHYVFDFWNGEPLAYVAESFAIVRELKQALEKTGVKGIEFRAMKASYSEEYEPQDDDLPLPEFVQMAPTDTVKGGPGWWIPAEDCPKCGRRQWDSTPFTVNAIVSAHENPELPRRTVIQSSYAGQDLFLLDDPGPPMMSGRLLDILMDNGVEEMEVQPAEFID